MKLKNRWVTYIDRSYDQMKASILSRLHGSNPEMTDHSESNPFIILVDIFCGIGEILNIYIDKLARENFIVTAQRRSSLLKHAIAFDYRVKARSSESVDVLFRFVDNTGANYPLASNMLLPNQTTIITEDGIPYRTTEDITLESGEYIFTIPMAQYSQQTNVELGISNTDKHQKFIIGSDYVHDSISINIGLDQYSRVDSFANSLPTSLHYVVDIDTDGLAKVRFGDGVKGMIPAAGNPITATYKTTLGIDGKIKKGALNTTPNITIPEGYTLLVDNANNSAGGSDYESNEELRTNIPNSIRSLDRMVSYEDHITIIEEIAGVSKAEVNFNCGKTIDIYIVPTGGGIAQTVLLDYVQGIAEEKKMVASFPVIKPAGETDLIIGATITARERMDLMETKNQVEQALVEFGNSDNQNINSEIRISDLIALMDNLSRVDYVDLTKLTTKPYARPVNHSKALNWTRNVTSAATTKSKWVLEYLSSSIRIFNNNRFLGQVAINETYVAQDDSISFKILDSPYEDGDRWEFIIYPYLKNIVFDDFTIPSIKLENLEISVNPAKSRNRR